MNRIKKIRSESRDLVTTQVVCEGDSDSPYRLDTISYHPQTEHTIGEDSDSIYRANTVTGRLDDPLTERIIGLAMKVHRVLGPGFLESVYRKALLIELRKSGLGAEDQKEINVFYEGAPVGDFVADILVEERVILELKSVETLAKIHEVQTVNYLTATGLDIGLLINFGGERLQFKRKFRKRDRVGGAPRELQIDPVS